VGARDRISPLPLILSPLLAILSLLLATLAWPQLGHAFQLNLTWVDNSTSEDGFAVERRTAIDGEFVQIATTGTDVTSYTDVGLLEGIAYCYRVRAFNSAGYSPYSNQACSVLPPTGSSLWGPSAPRPPSGLPPTGSYVWGPGSAPVPAGLPATGSESWRP
jgi:hypothetical protein